MCVRERESEREREQVAMAEVEREGPKSLFLQWTGFCGSQPPLWPQRALLVEFMPCGVHFHIKSGLAVWSREYGGSSSV
jgi:hypothetical protein